MFLGPGLVTLGVLLLWTARGGGSDREREAAGPRLLLQLGLAFLAPVAAAWLWRTISGGELATYAWSVTAFTLGVPGAALGAAGAVLLAWRALR